MRAVADKGRMDALASASADKRSLALALLQNGNEEDHALVGFYMLASGNSDAAKPHLDKAGGAAEAVRAASE